MDPAASVSPRRGFTLIETMIGSALATTIGVAILSAWMFFNQSFANLMYYGEQCQDQRITAEILTRQVRQMEKVVSCDANSVSLSDAASNQVSLVYNPDTQHLVCVSNDTMQVLLTNCVQATFSLFAAAKVNGTWNQAGTLFPGSARALQVRWQSLPSSVGSTSTSVGETPIIALRNWKP